MPLARGLLVITADKAIALPPLIVSDAEADQIVTMLTEIVRGFVAPP